MKTKVFITIDTEFSIGGAFSDPVRWKPVGPEAVLCPVAGKSHGLDFLLSTFDEYGIPATFFVEALNTNFFGDAPMGDLARRIAAAGHDVQLHLHPCWTYFKDPDWKNTLKSNPPSDHFNGRSVELLCQWMNEGIATFERWGLKRPLAMRTGSLINDSNVYTAMESCGFSLSSNVALAVFWPREPELQLFSGMHRIGKILEAPVLTYVDASIGQRVHHHLLTITGCSLPEMQSLLLRAQKLGVEAVVVLTHPFEYVKYEAPGFANMRPNPVNQGRLQKLCAFLRNNEDRFEATTFCRLAESEVIASAQNLRLKAPWHAVARRVLENSLNR